MYFYVRSIKQGIMRRDVFGWKPRGVVKLGTTGICTLTHRYTLVHCYTYKYQKFKPEGLSLHKLLRKECISPPGTDQRKNGPASCLVFVRIKSDVLVYS